ncbi:hypothetical protein ACJX0J_027622, partial [Zea mays]
MYPCELILTCDLILLSCCYRLDVIVLPAERRDWPNQKKREHKEIYMHICNRKNTRNMGVVSAPMVTLSDYYQTNFSTSLALSINDMNFFLASSHITNIIAQYLLFWSKNDVTNLPFKCLLVKEVGLASNKDEYGFLVVSHNEFVIFSDMTHEQIILQGREQMMDTINKMVPLVFPSDALAIAYLAAKPPMECAGKENL